MTAHKNPAADKLRRLAEWLRADPKRGATIKIQGGVVTTVFYGIEGSFVEQLSGIESCSLYELIEMADVLERSVTADVAATRAGDAHKP